jgi:O-antigen ligase
MFALFILTDAIIPLLRKEAEVDVNASQGDPLTQVILGATYLIACILLTYRGQLKLLFKDPYLVGIVGLCVISAAWSVDPGVTLRRSIALVGTSLFGVYLASRFTFSQQLKILAGTLGLCALLSIGFAILAPQYGVMQSEYAGAWRGVWDHKNLLGRMMILGAISFLLLATTHRKKAWIWWTGFAVSVGVLAMSRSMTSVVVFAGLLMALPVFGMLRWSSLRWRKSFIPPLIVFGGVAIIGFAALLFVEPHYISDIMRALGRDKTLTGRTEIWSIVLYMISRRPWLGYGYGAFWLDTGKEANDVWTEVGWQPPHSHNGYLEVCLAIGLVGLLVFLLASGTALKRAIRWIRDVELAEAYWPLTYLTFLLLYNFTEPTILKHNSVFWVLYVTTVVSLRNYQREPKTREVAEKRLQVYPQRVPVGGRH